MFSIYIALCSVTLEFQFIIERIQRVSRDDESIDIVFLVISMFYVYLPIFDRLDECI